MSFNRIHNPNKREEEVKKYLALKDSLRLKDRIEKMGEFGREEELSKIFKPVTTATSQLGKQLSEKIEELPSAITQKLPGMPGLPAPGLPAPGLPASEQKTSLSVPGDPELSGYLSNFANEEQAKKLNQILNLKKR